MVEFVIGASSKGVWALGVVVNLDEEREREDALAALANLVAADLEETNRQIVASMHSPVALIPQLAAHIVAAGGKRLRPVLTLSSARMCGYRTGKRHVKLAACIEFIHTATLLHDDVVDESVLRRGMASANALFGNKPSVLVGDFLFSRAFELMVEDGSLAVLGILSHASATIAEGEVLQLTTQNDLATTEERYLDVIRGKTAALFAAACRLGAVVAERGRAEEEALDSYGLNLGIAFQLIDDVLDYNANQARLGKTVGDDRRLPRGQDHAARAAGLSPRRRARARLLAPHHRGPRAAAGRRPGTRHGADGTPRGAARQRGPRAPLRHHGARRAGDLPRLPRAPRAGRCDRLRHLQGALSWLP